MSSDKPEALAQFPVVITLPILWGDQDAFGHVNNTIPIRWFESARIAYLEQSGMGHLMDASGLGPILASITCDYRRQLRYPDTVLIAARVSRIGRSSMTMEHAVYTEEQAAVAAEGNSAVVVFDYASNRPTRMPDDVRQACERLEGKTFDPAPG
jgi:acyl-CoA thioester hydrolase